MSCFSITTFNRQLPTTCLCRQLQRSAASRFWLFLPLSFHQFIVGLCQRLHNISSCQKSQVKNLDFCPGKKAPFFFLQCGSKSVEANVIKVINHPCSHLCQKIPKHKSSTVLPRNFFSRQIFCSLPLLKKKSKQEASKV